MAGVCADVREWCPTPVLEYLLLDTGPGQGHDSFHFFVTSSADDMVGGEALLVVNGPAGGGKYLSDITG